MDEIANEIEAGNARFVLVVACRDTYSRFVIETRESKFSREFPIGSLRGETEINPYIVAEKDIPDFSCKLINKEFGNGPFFFEKGAVLAIDEPTLVYVDRDLFKPITSIFQLVVKESIGLNEWQLDCSGDYVRIQFSPKFKEAHRRGKEQLKKSSDFDKFYLFCCRYAMHPVFKRYRIRR